MFVSHLQNQVGLQTRAQTVIGHLEDCEEQLAEFDKKVYGISVVD